MMMVPTIVYADNDPPPTHTNDVDFPLATQTQLTGNYCFTSGGVSLHEKESASFTVDVPGKPVKAYLYWTGRGKGENRESDPDILISRTGGPTDQLVTADANYNHEAKAEGRNPKHSWFAYSYEIPMATIHGNQPQISFQSSPFLRQGLGQLM